MSLDEIKKVFDSNNKSDITNLIGYLEDCFESYSLTENANAIVCYLVDRFNIETDDDIRERLLDAIQKAVVYESDLDCDFDSLSNNINSLPNNLVLGVIAIYECTCNKKYIPLLEKICLCGDDAITYEAQNALAELHSM